jgi:putative membrane protein
MIGVWEGCTTMMNGWMFGWMWIWPLILLGSLVLVVVGLVWLVSGRWSGAGDMGRSARRILDERYARGEIDEEEYQRRRAALR